MSQTSIAFDHIHIISADPEAAATWYVEFLLIGEIGGPSADTQNIELIPGP